MLPICRHFGNALQPRKSPPALGPLFASRSTRGLSHRGHVWEAVGSGVSLLRVQSFDQLLELVPIDLAEALSQLLRVWRRKPGWNWCDAGLSIAGPRLFLLAKQLIEQAGTGIEKLFDQALAGHDSRGM